MRMACDGDTDAVRGAQRVAAAPREARAPRPPERGISKRKCSEDTKSSSNWKLESRNENVAGDRVPRSEREVGMRREYM